MAELTDTDSEQHARPHRRRGDGGFRALFTPKNFVVVLMTVSGLVFSAGKWLGAREHNDQTLGEQIDVLEARTKVEKLDQRYVTYDALHAEIGGMRGEIAVQKADLDWIKSALLRLEGYQQQRIARDGK